MLPTPFASFKLRLNFGFTLIELLVVIAVIGVMAAIVLLAVNPGEQLARGRDANRISVVEGLGKAMSNYVTANNGTIYVIDGAIPANQGTWQNRLTVSKDLANTISVTGPSGGTACAGGTALSDIQGGICYTVDAASPTRFAIWTIIESARELQKASGSTTPCAASRGIVFFDSSKSLVQVACMSLTGTGTNPISGTMTNGPFTP